jgi:hypothetical protein
LGSDSGEKVLLKAEFIPPVPIKGEKGASEVAGKLYGDVITGVPAEEPGSFCSNAEDIRAFGDTRNLDGEGVELAEVATDSADTCFRAELEVGNTVDGLCEVPDNDGKGGSEGREEGEELAGLP